ncbi:hypothetical protein HMPREF3185_01678 [Porphyromonas somerae]|uniref:Uncharacterized protein n=1 Tax=Porphyromonas somerae TaxID=322095 RepID=A0A134B3G3_9PORP|nr:hypothetical protein HMPREF3184_01678 [Porphyromonadaceae bacterium KA00676]KXB74470.1 hypothetical protein HMPREF3185_01678 [Porphyromonas somerae]
MPRYELRGDKASYSFSHDAVLVVCRSIIIVLRGGLLRKRLLVRTWNNYSFERV